MKRASIPTFVLTLSILLCFGMFLRASDNEFGIRSGFQSAALYSSDSGKIDNNLNGFYLGFFRDFKIVSVVRLGLGLEYMQNGNSVDKENKILLGYVGIPLNVKAKVGPVYALTGTGINILLSERLLEDGNKKDPLEDDRSKGVDVPFYIGGGLKFLFVGIEARYHWGLLNVNDDIKNRYLQVGLTLSF